VNHQDSDPPFRSLVELLRHRAQTEPDRRAYVFLQDGEVEGGALTFAGLDERARAIAADLQARARPGDRVLLLYPPGLEFMAAFFGCLYAGVVAVPSYPPKRNRPDQRLQAIAADAGARIALTDADVLGEIDARLQNSAGLRSLTWIATDAAGGPPRPAWRERAPEPSDLAFLQYTSGSTSTPKGVMVSHGNLLSTLEDLDRGWDHTRDSVMVTWLPIFHDMGLVYGALMPLYRGFQCVLLPPAAFLQRPYRWVRAISHYRGTHSAAPNFAYDLCVASIPPEQRAEFDLRSWHFSLNAAEPVRADTLARFNEAFRPCGLSPLTVTPGYGLAEATLKVAALPRAESTRICQVQTEELARNRVVPGAAGAPGVQAIVGCGWGQVGNRILIVDPETRRVCPPEAVGEIWFAGPSVAQGYWNRPGETAEVFGARLAGPGDSGPFLRTGDLGFMLHDEVYVTGRLKDLIIIRGLNHYPQDIELTVEQCHPALRPGCGAAFSVEAGGREALVIAQEVERTHLRKLNADEVVGCIRQAVAEKHELPVHAVALLRTGSIPKTSSGKIQRRACRALFLDGQLELVGMWQELSAPADAADVAAAVPAVAAAEETVERAVVETWLVHRIAQRLKVPTAGIDPQEPFSRYGLDSLAAVELSGALETWLGRRLAPTILYDYPTARLLAAHLAKVASAPPADADGGGAGRAVPVAVVGLGCRFPGADSPEAYWTLLADGGDAVSAPPAARWQEADRGGLRWGGFLHAVDGFDSDFFGISPREADLMDPQQRLLLEVAWEALEDAGIAAGSLAGTRTGVFVGISTNDYGRLLAGQPAASEAHAGTGNALSIAANRISYWLDLRGPSWAVDAACSSSLVAIHQACRDLRSGECALALAGGVNLILSPDLTTAFAQAGMLAADGRCKTFDAAADGYARGEGCGLVVLKRLADAQRDGDRVLAVIRGTAVNQDGRSNGLTAPNGPAQRAVVRAALRDADLVPAALSYVEAHGTGTALGDPIEVNALKEVLLEGRDPLQPCWLGSVKTNIGHLEAAAGVAGFIKLVLALRHRKIPPHLHLKTLNPLITFAGTPLAVPAELTDWPAPSGARFAGVSSFGFGGTNAHVIVGEAPAEIPPAAAARTGEVLVLSARTAGALRQLADRYEKFLGTAEPAAWADVCHTAAVGRAPMAHRLAVPAANSAEAAERLAQFARDGAAPGVWAGQAADAPRAAFLYSGQGSVYPGMGLELSAGCPEFRAAFEECAALVRQRAGWNLAEVVASPEALARTEYCQVALFGVEYALTRLWAAWGVTPAVVVGHSAGEYAAACAAGLMTLSAAVEMLLARARLMAGLGETGAMAAVPVPAEDVAAVIARHGVELAAVNAPRQVVLTGERGAIRAAVEELRGAGIAAQLLEVKQGYHSRQMEPMLAEFRRTAARIPFARPRLEFLSTVSAGVETDAAADAEYWVRQIRRPVRFAEAMRVLADRKPDLVVEIGPRGVLAALGQQTCPDGPAEWLLSLRHGRGEWAQMLESAGRAWVRGAPVAWRRCAGDRTPSRCTLPLYPFQRQRHWRDAAPAMAPLSLNDESLARLASAVAADPALSPADREAAPRILRALARQQRADSDAGPWRDLLYRVRWVPRRRGTASAAPPGPWLLVGALGPVPAALTAELERRGRTVQLAGEFLPGEWAGIVLVAGAAPSAEAECARLLALAQAPKAAGPPGRLWIVTEGAAAAADADAAELALDQAPLWGLGRVLALEDGQSWGGLVDLPRPAQAEDIAALADELLAPDGEDQVSLRPDGRRVLRLQRLEPPAEGGPRLRPDAAYWVTGGLGGLGLHLARWLVRRGAANLVLTARRAPTGEAERVIAELRAAGTRVLALRADVAEPAEVRRVLAEAAASLGPVRGILHAAGVVAVDALPSLTPAALAAVLRPKVAGGWALHEATRDSELDFLVFFSSVASVWGSKGQAHYAAANHYLDALAHFRRARGLPALSVNWGPWDGAGMAGGAEAGWLRRSGLAAMPPEEALGALDRLLGCDSAQAVVARVNWPIFRELYEMRGPRPLLAELDGGPAPAEAALPAAPAPAVAQLADAPPAEREARLISLLQGEVASVLGYPGGRLPDPRRGFFEMGLDSLLAVELRNRLARTFARKLPATLAFDHANIQALADYLAAKVLGWSAPAAPASGLDPALASRLERLENLVRRG
jgi:acyl transferase domain-containing protein/acyl-CoA synthetase (AMP-forming)/AMP-acid ligase II/acyl carrier protein